MKMYKANNLRVLIYCLFSVYLCCSISNVFSQKTTIYTNAENEFRQGIELFQHEKYNSAQRQFDRFLKKTKPEHTSIDMIAMAEYYASVCAYELFHKDAESRLLRFLENHSIHPFSNNVRFTIGKLYYREKAWKKALQWFATIDAYELSEEEKAEHYFKQGYCHFQQEDFDKAKMNFREIGHDQARYGSPALYYYSHIHYTEKRYETAYQGFKKLQSDEVFAPIVPFYMAQILYLQEKYDELIAFAPPLLQSNVTKRVPEIAKLLGESYYRRGKYAEAIPLLEQFEEKSGRSSRMDKYELGYAFYRISNYSEALQRFSTLGNTEDSISQLAAYHSGDCYLNMGNKPFARNAFKSASAMSFYPDIKEDALFNYAKLAYDLSMNPFNEAILALEDYLNKFPESKRKNEVYNFLTEIYVNTRNYDAALASMEKISNFDLKLKTVWQKVAFYRAMEHINNADFDDAIAMLAKSNKYAVDKNTEAEAAYWTAESHYRMKRFDEAKIWYEAFLKNGVSLNKNLFPLAEYGLAYCFFKEENYEKAANSFRKFLNYASVKDEKMVVDANLRAADCFFVRRDFAGAIEYYDRAARLDKQEVDYALFQTAMCYGILGKYASKIEIIKTILGLEKSRYKAEATFEVAETYLLMENYVDAERFYNDVLKTYSETRFGKPSRLALALIYYNSHQDEKAIEALKQVVELYPGTAEAAEAVFKLQRIYVDNGEIEKFNAFAKANKITGIEQSRLDSATYESAEKLFLKAEYERAATGFDLYLKSYPGGYFVLKALFGKAESYYALKQSDSALVAYTRITQFPKNTFTEKSLIRAAMLEFTAGNFPMAVTHYLMLEEISEQPEVLLQARIQMMRCYNKMNKPINAIHYAKLITVDPKSQQEIVFEAKLIEANYLLQSNELSTAMDVFKSVQKNNLSKSGAESQYQIAYIYFLQNSNKECEKECLNLIKQYPSYETWLAKTFLLLADNYLKLNDAFQAKLTLQTLIDSSDDIEILQLAKDKLASIILAEENAAKPNPQSEIEIQIAE